MTGPVRSVAGLTIPQDRCQLAALLIRTGLGVFRRNGTPLDVDAADLLKGLLSVAAAYNASEDPTASGVPGGSERLLPPRSTPAASVHGPEAARPAALSPAQAAKRLPISRERVAWLCRNGKVPGACRDERGHWRIPLAWVTAQGARRAS